MSLTDIEEVTEAKEQAAAEPVETMEDYKDLLEASYRRIRVGDVLTGTVAAVNDREVLVDFNYYAPGIIPVEELSSDPDYKVMEKVFVGDSITATVVKIDDGAGNMVLSGKEAMEDMAWENILKMKEDHTVISGKIGGIVKGGAIMYVEGIRGFIPASKLDLKFVEDVNPYLGKEVEAVIITADEEKNKLVLSVRDVLLDKRREARNAKIMSYTVGTVCEGTVESIESYGVFVKLEDGVSGLVHISQLSDKKVKSAKEAVSEGQTVKVKVIRVENNKISLSMKGLNRLNGEEPEEEKEEKFEYRETGKATTGLASLLAGIKLS